MRLSWQGGGIARSARPLDMIATFALCLIQQQLSAACIRAKAAGIPLKSPLVCKAGHPLLRRPDGAGCIEGAGKWVGGMQDPRPCRPPLFGEITECLVRACCSSLLRPRPRLLRAQPNGRARKQKGAQTQKGADYNDERQRDVSFSRRRFLGGRGAAVRGERSGGSPPESWVGSGGGYLSNWRNHSVMPPTLITLSAVWINTTINKMITANNNLPTVLAMIPLWYLSSQLPFSLLYIFFHIVQR